MILLSGTPHPTHDLRPRSGTGPGHTKVVTASTVVPDRTDLALPGFAAGVRMPCFDGLARSRLGSTQVTFFFKVHVGTHILKDGFAQARESRQVKSSKWKAP